MNLVHEHESEAQRSRALRAHLSKFQRALNARDICMVRQLSLYSFVSATHRARAWPLLLGIDAPPSPLPMTAGPYQSKYASQIEKDVLRSLSHFTECQRMTHRQRDYHRQNLSLVLQTLFERHADLHYIQGFHDIAGVMVLTMSDDLPLAYQCIETLALTRLRFILQPSLEFVLKDIDLLFPLLAQTDARLHEALVVCVPQAWFTLSWVLTWFAHNVSSLTIAQHCFDFFLAQHELMPIYCIAALCRIHRDRLLSAVSESEEGGQQASLHLFFQELDISSHQQVVAIGQLAKLMFDRHPPAQLMTTHSGSDGDSGTKNNQASAKRTSRNNSVNGNGALSHWSVKPTPLSQSPRSWRVLSAVGVSVLGAIIAIALAARSRMTPITTSVS